MDTFPKYLRYLSISFEDEKDAFFSHAMFKDADAADIKIMKELNIAKEADWLNEYLKTCKYRVTLILFDTNFRNCILKDVTKNIDKSSKVSIIDMDTIQYNLRGIDFGVHFFEHIFAGMEIRPGSRFPTDDEKKLFLSYYQDAIRRLNTYHDYDPNGVDSIENLLMESILGSQYWLLSLIGETCLYHESFDYDLLPTYQLINVKYQEHKNQLIKLSDNCQ